MFSKRQIRKIHRDQDRLNQFRIKKNITQQLNLDLQETIKTMQTGSEEGKVVRNVNVNNLVSSCMKIRNEELKRKTNNDKIVTNELSPTMITGTIILSELD